MNYDLVEKYKMDSVLEKYIGRKPELLKVEELLGILCQRMKSNFRTSNEQTGKNLNESKENKEIEKIFKSFFKLKNFTLNWMWVPLPMAMTAIKTFQILDKNYVRDSDGRHFNKNLFVGVNIATGLVTNYGLTNSEIMALILHEIGHSFKNSMSQILASINPIARVSNKQTGESKIFFNPLGIAVPAIKDILGGHNFINNLFKQFENLKDDPKYKSTFKFLNTVFEEIDKISRVIPVTLGIKPAAIKAALNPTKTLFLYSVEKHSDGFAVDYGYGKDLASALSKITRLEGNPKMDIPVLKWIYAFDDLVNDMIIEPLSGYPSTHNRQRSALDRLRMAAKDKDLSPELRKELEQQIKDFEEYYENYMKLENNDNAKYLFTWKYRTLVDKLAGGKLDIREVLYNFSKDNPKNHDYYQAYLNEQKELKS